MSLQFLGEYIKLKNYYFLVCYLVDNISQHYYDALKEIHLDITKYINHLSDLQNEYSKLKHMANVGIRLPNKCDDCPYT